MNANEFDTHLIRFDYLNFLIWWLRWFHGEEKSKAAVEALKVRIGLIEITFKAENVWKSKKN